MKTGMTPQTIKTKLCDVTLRMPESDRDLLHRAAHIKNRSMNKWAAAALVQEANNICFLHHIKEEKKNGNSQVGSGGPSTT